MSEGCHLFDDKGALMTASFFVLFARSAVGNWPQMFLKRFLEFHKVLRMVVSIRQKPVTMETTGTRRDKGSISFIAHNSNSQYH